MLDQKTKSVGIVSADLAHQNFCVNWIVGAIFLRTVPSLVGLGPGLARLSQ